MASIAYENSLRLSASALDLYRRCPRAFRFRHIEKASTTATPTAAQAQGRALHAAIAKFSCLASDERTQPALQAVLTSVWRKHAPRRTFTTVADEIRAGTEARAMLDNYFEWFEDGEEPLAVESAISATLPNGVEIYGRADRISQRRGGNIEVVDFKSGSARLESADLRSETAAQVYLLAASATFGAYVDRVRYVYLGSGTAIEWTPEPEEVEETERRLTLLTDAILADNLFDPWPTDACHFCDFANRCIASKRLSLVDVETDDVPF